MANKNWTIRSVPHPLRNRIKAQAAARGMTLAEWLEFAEKELEAMAWFRSATPKAKEVK